MTEHSRDHAVVIGASMAGLLCARVLSETHRRVTLLDRDQLPADDGNRRGVPQGRHAHLLLARGMQVIGDLFPGLVAELEAAGAPVLSDLDQFHLEILGHLLNQDHHDEPDEELRAIQASRPFLEGRVRARLRALGNVELRDGFAVSAPVHDAGRQRVVGVEGAPVAGGDTEMLDADLVVDASGRAGRATAWLRDWGYEAPPVAEIRVRVSYVSQLLRLPPDPRLRKLYTVGPRPDRPVGMALFRYEADTWMFTVINMGENIETTREAMLEAVSGFLPPELADGLPAAEALTEPVSFGYPSSKRHHYEKLRRFPEGFLVAGDAVCSFNPIYGQGMTVASAEADALRRTLAAGDTRLARRFFRAAAAPVGAAWQLSCGPDLAMPGVEGELTTQMRIGNAWVERVLHAAESDEAVAIRFLRVTSLVDGPPALFAPGMVGHVVRPRRSTEQVGRPAPVG